MNTLQFPTPDGEPRRYDAFHDLILAYLATLKGRTQINSVLVAKQWLLTLSTTPTRKQILERHLAKARGIFNPARAKPILNWP